MATPDKAVDLAQATNALNEALRDAEVYLTSLNLGVTADLPLLGIPEVTLCFGKLDQRWTLYARYRDGSCEPVLNANRRIRVTTAESIGALEHKLREQAKSEAAKVAEAAKDLISYLDRRRNE